MAEKQPLVAVFAFPFGTHAAPLLGLTRRVAAAAPSARFVFFSTAASNDSLFSSCDGNVARFDVPDGFPDGFVFGSNPSQGVEHFMKVAPRNLRVAAEAAEEQAGAKISCLVTDAFIWFAAAIAEERSITWVPVWTGGPRPLLAHLLDDHIRDKVGVSGNEDAALDFISGFSDIRVGDLPEGVVSGDREFGISAVLHKMGHELPRSTALVINTHEELDAAIIKELGSRLKNCLAVGPFPLVSPTPCKDDHGCLPWLHKHKPASVTYISFGSFISLPPNEIAAMAEALEQCGLPFLWSFRGNAKEKLPEGFMERTGTQGKIVPWAPQTQVLQHPSVGVFVTHCGWNSVLESVIGGVPLICRPFFGDQRLNMRTVEAVWGTGVGVDGGAITKAGILAALQLIRSTDKGQNMRDKLATHRELALKSVQPSGSSARHFKTLVQIVTS